MGAQILDGFSESLYNPYIFQKTLILNNIRSECDIDLKFYKLTKNNKQNGMT